MNGTWVLDKLDLLPEGVQPQITVDELIACEDIVRNDPTVQKLAKEVGTYVGTNITNLSLLPSGIEPHQICCDGWTIGQDVRFPEARRIQQALVFARLYDHDNLYAHPLVPATLCDRSIGLTNIRAGLHPRSRCQCAGSVACW